MRDLLPVAPPPGRPRPGFGELALALRDAAPPGRRRAERGGALRGPRAPPAGGSTSAWRASCARPAVTLADLEHRDGRLVAWLDGRARAVDVVYHRTDEDRFTARTAAHRARRRAARALPRGAAGLRERARVGRGRRQARARLRGGDGAASTSTRSRCCPRCPPTTSTKPGVPGLERLDELVVKPRGEMGGEGVVIWRDADADTRERDAGRGRARARGVRGPGAGHPVGAPHRVRRPARAAPRGPAPLRAALDDEGVRILPGGLSRVALERGSHDREQRPGRRREGHLGAELS